MQCLHPHLQESSLYCIHYVAVLKRDITDRKSPSEGPALRRDSQREEACASCARVFYPAAAKDNLGIMDRLVKDCDTSLDGVGDVHSSCGFANSPGRIRRLEVRQITHIK